VGACSTAARARPARPAAAVGRRTSAASRRQGSMRAHRRTARPSATCAVRHPMDAATSRTAGRAHPVRRAAPSCLAPAADAGAARSPAPSKGTTALPTGTGAATSSTAEPARPPRPAAAAGRWACAGRRTAARTRAPRRAASSSASTAASSAMAAATSSCAARAHRGRPAAAGEHRTSAVRELWGKLDRCRHSRVGR
jgi:hypothetical protein